MTLLPILLFILGVLCLIWAMRMGNSTTKSSQEILTILQGLAGVKKEISQVHKGLREVKAQIGDHELRLIRNENVQADLRSEVNVQKININQLTSSPMNIFAQPQPQPHLQSQHQPHSQTQTSSPYSSHFTHSNAIVDPPQHKNLQANTYSFNERQLQEESPIQSLPEKYQWVLELYHQGWSVAEIAGHLAISRDAVNMVLRTAPKGKGLES